jgi:cytochrome P450
MDTLAGGDFTSETALRSYGEMHEYWMSLVEERRAHPGPDLISQILHTEVKGDPLSVDEVAGFCSLLHDAAQNTTMNMITHSVMTFGRHPDARRTLAAQPQRWDQAFEELLRFVSPVQGLARTTTTDVTLHDVTIPAGEQVLMLYGAANHDERAYADPEVFDLDRTVSNHYAFGHGIHYCLGNAVARLEVRVAVQTLMDVIGDWSVDESGVELNQLVPTRGVAHAPIQFTATSA